MTAAKTAPPSTYVSGFCGVGRHEHCWGNYRTAQCTCTCHQPPAEPEPEPPSELAAAPAPAPAPRHCPTCACEDPR